MKKLFKILLLLLLLGGESGSYTRLEKVGVNPQASLRRIKDIEDCWHFNTKIGKVTLTDHRFDTHIHIKHPFVTPSAIRKVLEHQAVMYKSRKRWIFEKDNLRVVVGIDNKVVTAYYMDGR